MEIMYTSISVMEKGMHNGLEVRKTRDKKIEKMQRAMYLMKCFIDDNFIELAEKELGEIVQKDWKFKECKDNPNLYEIIDNETPEEKEHRDKVYDRAREIEEQMRCELWEIFKGQDYSKFKQPPEDSDRNKKYEYWIEQFDGSGMGGWWD